MASLFYDLLTFFGITAAAPQNLGELFPRLVDPVPVRVRHD